MRNQLSHIELVERYLNGSMSQEEKFAFEAKMHGDPELAKDVELQRMLMNQIAFNAFRNDLAAFDPSAAVTKPWWKGRYFLLSLSGALLLTAALFTWIAVRPGEPANGNEQAGRKSGTENLAFAVTRVPPADPRPQEEQGKRAVPADPAQQPGRGMSGYSAEFNARFVPGFRTVVMNSERDFTFQMAVSKSTVRIPANSMRSRTGEDVTGEVEIRYREYRNAAEMAFSRIPMTYTEDGTEYHFNSAGMFEIRAYQDGKELQLKSGKPMTVDYNATEKLENCYFWQLRDEKWQKLREIDFAAQDSAAKQPAVAVEGNLQLPGKTSEMKSPGVLLVNAESTLGNEIGKLTMKRDVPGSFRFYQLQAFATDSGIIVNNFPDHSAKVKISAKGYRTLTVSAVKVYRDTWSEMDVKLQPRRRSGMIGKITRTFTGAKKDSLLKIKGSAEIRERAGFLSDPEKDSIKKEELKNQASSKLLKGNGDAGHTYPNIVRGLNCPDFGVYNCDQIYRLPNQVKIEAKYVDENGKRIAGGAVLSMIDLRYNGAFSNDPKSFTCSSAGRNVLLLFTDDNKLYAIREEDFKAMKIRRSGEYTFRMKEMSPEIRTTDDLKTFLGL